MTGGLCRLLCALLLACRQCTPQGEWLRGFEENGLIQDFVPCCHVPLIDHNVPFACSTHILSDLYLPAVLDRRRPHARCLRAPLLRRLPAALPLRQAPGGGDCVWGAEAQHGPVHAPILRSVIYILVCCTCLSLRFVLLLLVPPSLLRAPPCLPTTLPASLPRLACRPHSAGRPQHRAQGLV